MIEDYYKKKHPKSLPEPKLPVGRPDIIDIPRQIVVEIKPDNPRKVKEGFKQAVRYADFLDYDLVIVVAYPPGTNPRDFADPIGNTHWYPGHRNTPPR